MYDGNTLALVFKIDLQLVFWGCTAGRRIWRKYDFIILWDIFSLCSPFPYSLSPRGNLISIWWESVFVLMYVCKCVGQFRYNEKHASLRHIDVQILCTCKIPIYHFMQEIFFYLVLPFILQYEMKSSPLPLFPFPSLSFCHSLPSQVNGNKDFKSCQVERADSQIDWICRAGRGRRTAGAEMGCQH